MKKKSTAEPKLVQMHIRDLKPPSREELERRRRDYDTRPIDFSDIPETTPEQWAEAVARHRQRMAELDAVPKERITILIDADVLEAFRYDGPRYQTRINMALRQFLTEYHLLNRDPSGASKFRDKAGDPPADGAAPLEALDRAMKELRRARSELLRRAG